MSQVRPSFTGTRGTWFKPSIAHHPSRPLTCGKDRLWFHSRSDPAAFETIKEACDTRMTQSSQGVKGGEVALMDVAEDVHVPVGGHLYAGMSHSD